MFQFLKNQLSLPQNASHPGFINPHLVEVASIGTVPGTFAFFLFLPIWKAERLYFVQIERICRVVNRALSIVSIYIEDFCEFVLKSVHESGFFTAVFVFSINFTKKIIKDEFSLSASILHYGHTQRAEIFLKN